jgi:hypothetical protein
VGASAHFAPGQPVVVYVAQKSGKGTVAATSTRTAKAHGARATRVASSHSSASKSAPRGGASAKPATTHKHVRLARN